MPKPLPADLCERLSKLVPLLSSDQMGEVIATIEAIKRALTAAECDWHDLTAALTSAPSPTSKGNGAGAYQGDPDSSAYQYYQYQQSQSQFNSNDIRERINDIFNSGIKLSNAATGFLYDMNARARTYKVVRLTPKQKAWFDALAAEAAKANQHAQAPF